MDDREARRLGDIVRGLAPLSGALLAGFLAVVLERASLGRAWVGFARASWGDGSVGVVEALRVVRAGVVPIVAAAFVGALGVGLLQTRFHLGGLSAPRIEPRRPGIAITLLGWLSLLVVLVDGARAVIGLHAAAPGALATAALAIAARSLEATLVVLLVLALVDHLWKARTRAARLVDEPVRARPPQPAPDDGRADEIVAGARCVLFDEERAVVIHDANGEPTLSARGRGLAGIALREAARVRGVKLRAVADLSQLETLTLGTPIPDTQRAAWGLA